MSLTLSAQPGFTELTDATFDAGNALTDSAMKSLNSDAKFAAVRNEQFYGFYRNGEQVVLPVSAADGYEYSRSECLYLPAWYWTGSAPSALNGTQSPPVGGSTSAAGTVLQMKSFVDPASGLVSTVVSYYQSSQHDTNDGILFVITFAMRNR